MKHIQNKILAKGLMALIFCLLLSSADAQEGTVIDKVIAVVGDEIVTKAELEDQFLQLSAQGIAVNEKTRCQIIEELMFQKLLLNQAKLDSVEVSDGQVESELDNRLRYFVAQIGSEKALEKYYDKSISQIKSEMRTAVKEQMLVQSMRQNVVGDIKVTPAQVRTYFEKIPKDSLPLINSEVEVAQIVIHSPMPKASIDAVKDRLNGFRERVKNGESFSTMAVLYSEDKGSATKGGEIGYVGRAEVDPAFAAVAFKLKPGNVSRVVESQFGFHIIQLIDRKGDKVNVRHILLKPKIDSEALEKARIKADSIANLIQLDSLTFAEAALLYSDDEESKKNGGLIVNPYSGNAKFQMDQLDPKLFFVIDKMQSEDLSESIPINDERGKPGYRLVKLVSRTDPHRANLSDDYQRIKDAALAEKEAKSLQNWIKVKIETTYVSIDKDYQKGCNFQQDWISQLSKN